MFGTPFTPGGGIINPQYSIIRAVAHAAIPNAAWTKITFNTVTYDPLGWFNPVNPTRVTPGKDGLYFFTAGLYFLSNPTGIRYIRLEKNGAATFLYADVKQAIVGDATILPLPKPIQLISTDYVELWVYQSSGAALGLDGISLTTFEVH